MINEIFLIYGKYGPFHFFFFLIISLTFALLVYGKYGQINFSLFIISLEFALPVAYGKETSLNSGWLRDVKINS